MSRDYLKKKHSMAVQAVLVVLLVLPAAVKTENPKGGVSFWRNDVTLTCPKEGTFHEKDDKTEKQNKDKTHTFPYQGRVNYHCKYGASDTYQFYVEGKACENCFELDAVVFLVIIIADLVATVVVMMMVFKCTKRKDSTGATQTSRAPAPPAGRAPPASSSAYEALNPHTRSQDTYSLVNRTG